MLPALFTVATLGSIAINRLNTYCNKKKTNTTPVVIPSEQERKDAFLAVYDDLVQFLLEESREYELPEHHVNYLKRMLDYNVQGGKLNRGLAVADTLLYLKPNATEQELYQARVLGWCIEWLQAFFLVADDIMDASVTRRGNPCWYKVDDVRMVACNDYLIIESHIYRILRRFFRSHESYLELIELLHETTFQTELGQLNDTRIQPPNVTDLNLNDFSIQVYNRIVKYKTAYYSFYLPIALGMVLAGIKDTHIYKMTEEICIQMGEYFQIQDDYLDCYGDPSVIGKIGRDIEEGKCCWLVIQALDRVNSEQRKILEESYKKDDPEHVKRVKQLYADLNMEDIYFQYEKKTCDELNNMIERIATENNVNKQVFTSLLAKIAKRTK